MSELKRIQTVLKCLHLVTISDVSGIEEIWNYIQKQNKKVKTLKEKLLKYENCSTCQYNKECDSTHKSKFYSCGEYYKEK